MKDLSVRDSKSKKIQLPNRAVQYHKDVLTQHFYNQIYNHGELQVKEKNHTNSCSCKIQMDLQPKLSHFVHEIYAKLSNQSQRKYVLKYLDDSVLTAFAYMLNIGETLQR